VPDRKLASCTTVADIEALARRRASRPIIDFISAGSGSERTLRRNIEAYGEFEFRSHMGRNVAEVDLSTEFLGIKLALPLAIAPTGGLGLVCRGAETATARAAAKAGILFFLSTMSTATLEQVAEASDGPKVMQIYALTDRDFTLELIERAKKAGYNALCVTIDVQDSPPRPRSVRWGDLAGSGLPPLRTMVAMARHPLTAFELQLQRRRGLMDVIRKLEQRGRTFGIRNDITWDDLEQMRQAWGGPFLVKGVLRRDDMESAMAIHSSAVVVCNHGGTGLDGAMATVDALNDIILGGPPPVPLALCGGIRSGADLVTGLALGATIGMTGRPFLMGAAAAGEAGVTRVIEILRDQFATTMRLTGCRSVADIDRTLVRSRRPIQSSATFSGAPQ
jgi:isopentenyl diphosphate isomerase/L-lactate dehydrogenase-like FMN-dependent dehydrogenase